MIGGPRGCLWHALGADPSLRPHRQRRRPLHPSLHTCGQVRPSRAIVLTGRHAWQNEQAGNHMAYFPAPLKSWPEVLTERGWHMGMTGKGWGPGIANDVAGLQRQITGKLYAKRKAPPPASGMTPNDYAANFIDFLNECPQDKPWCFYYGSLEPHREYEYNPV